MVDQNARDAKEASTQLSAPFALIGRDSGCDLVLDHDAVSRKHAYCQVIAGRLFVIDLESRTGIRWADGLATQGWAEGERWFELGPFRIWAEWVPESNARIEESPRLSDREIDARLQDQSPATGGARARVKLAEWPRGCRFPFSSRPLVHDSLPGLTLEFPGAKSQRREWSMRSLITFVGGSPLCKVRIESERVSRFECALVRTPHGAWAVGLGGRAGVTLETTAARFFPLAHGDDLYVGGNQIRVRVTGPTTGAWGAGSHQLALTRPVSRAIARRIAQRAELSRRDGPAAGGVAWRGGPLASANPALSPRTEFLDRTASQLIDQFGEMQSELLDHVREALLTMGHWLGKLHADQLEQIRAELAELRNAVAESEQLRKLVDASGRNALTVDRPTQATTNLAPGSTPQTQKPGHPFAPTSASAPWDAKKGPSAKPESEAAQRIKAPVDCTDGDQLHRELVERIERLQLEQRTRWQRVIQRVTGHP